MFKPLLLAAVLLAQVPMPMGPRVPMNAGSVDADGITVRGVGNASAQATSARLTLRISARNNALTLDAQTLQPIVDALISAGVDRSSVSLPPYLVGQARTNQSTITATVQHPTQAMLQQGMVTVANAFAAHPELLLNSAEVQIFADGCEALRRSAEAQAIAHARQNAEFVAQQINEKLGRVLQVEDFSGPNFGPQSDACSSTYMVGPYPGQQVDPADMLTVKVFSSVTMRFAIKP